MSIDPRFIITSDLESYFVDKTTGEPLAAGEVWFYSDDDRTTLKPVYQIVPSGLDYTYEPLPNPCILSSVGTFQDALGNNIVPYYFPYEGSPDGTSKTVELYYIVVKSSNNVMQFTRYAWPNFTQESSQDDNQFTNFIPNGQFLAHTDYPANPVTHDNAGKIVQSVTNVAQGNWQFVVPTTPPAGDYFVTFNELPNSVAVNIGDYPRYAIDINCTTIGDQFRKLRIRWNNVNQFSYVGAPVLYSMFFNAESVDTNPHDIEIYIYKNYGTGGNPSNEENISVETKTITSSFTGYNVNGIDFGSNSGKIVGTNNDDYVAIEFRFPNSTFNIQMTDFCMKLGNDNITAYPETTPAQTFMEAVAGNMPTPATDGSDLYLPLVLTRFGVEFDDSMIGKIFASPFANPNRGELLCNGTSYLASALSSDGIPYSRLANKLFNNVIPQMYNFGTGYQFVTSIISLADATSLNISQNNYGTMVSPASGTMTITNTPRVITTGTAQFSQRTYTYSGNVILVRTNNNGSVTANTTGGAISVLYAPSQPEPTVPTTYSLTVNSIPAAGTHINFTDGFVSSYVWFRVNNAGVDPFGGTGVQVNIPSTISTIELTQLLMSAFDRHQVDLVTFPAAALITPNSYWIFSSNNGANNYYVWYAITGNAEVDPAISGKIGIKVSLPSTANAQEVANGTFREINRAYFGTPDLQGVFLRGYGQGAFLDTQRALRGTQIPSVFGDAPNTVQLDSFAGHSHPFTTAGIAEFASNQGGSDWSPTGGPLNSKFEVASGTSSIVGGTETRPVNQYVTYVIRY